MADSGARSGALSALSTMVQVEPRPTKREWLEAYMNGLERSQFNGSVDIRLTYRNGAISLLIPTVKADAGPERASL